MFLAKKLQDTSQTLSWIQRLLRVCSTVYKKNKEDQWVNNKDRAPSESEERSNKREEEHQQLCWEEFARLEK